VRVCLSRTGASPPTKGCLCAPSLYINSGVHPHTINQFNHFTTISNSYRRVPCIIIRHDITECHASLSLLLHALSTSQLRPHDHNTSYPLYAGGWCPIILRTHTHGGELATEKSVKSGTTYTYVQRLLLVVSRVTCADTPPARPVGKISPVCVRGTNSRPPGATRRCIATTAAGRETSGLPLEPPVGDAAGRQVCASARGGSPYIRAARAAGVFACRVALAVAPTSHAPGAGDRAVGVRPFRTAHAAAPQVMLSRRELVASRSGGLLPRRLWLLRSDKKG
jgi:hypothetical protein